jgi:hypothetical protein
MTASEGIACGPSTPSVSGKGAATLRAPLTAKARAAEAAESICIRGSAG